MSSEPYSPKGFIRLSRRVHLHQPASPSPSGTQPILLLSLWLAAPRKLIDRYTAQYITLFPHTTILLLSYEIYDLFYFDPRTLRPAVDLLLNWSTDPDVRMAAAIYSNGGAYSLMQVVEMYHKDKGEPLPFHTILLDSSPGNAEMSVRLQGLIPSLPPFIRKNPPLGLLATGFFWGAIVFAKTYNTVVGAQDHVPWIREGLVDSELFETGGWRHYVYSKEDRMVPWDAVESHVKEAEARGWRTTTELFHGSGHCAHAMVDKERYWGIVEKAFEGLEGKPTRSRL